MRGDAHGLFAHLKLVDIPSGGVVVGVRDELTQSREHGGGVHFLVSCYSFLVLLGGYTYVYIHLSWGLEGVKGITCTLSGISRGYMYMYTCHGGWKG